VKRCGHRCLGSSRWAENPNDHSLFSEIFHWLVAWQFRILPDVRGSRIWRFASGIELIDESALMADESHSKDFFLNGT
jgi:hypothetical protein